MSENQAVRAVVQRVSSASVRVGGQEIAACGQGLLVLLGVASGDTDAVADRVARKVARLRIFEDERGRFDRSLTEVGGEALVVSQFTLIADTAKGTRPSFTHAAPPECSEPLYERFVAALREHGIKVGTGIFGARMEVALVNDGPVTIIFDVEP
jgi:D-tyrosyl-tRNA(Tyr) deacylase